MKKRLLSTLMALMMIVSIAAVFPSASPIVTLKAAAYTAHTQAEALNWIRSKVGQGVEYSVDSYRYQCVDLIQAYYNYLGVPVSYGNGKDYATNTLPSGWSRVQGGKPQPGDILVFGASSGNQYGHVAIYEADRIHYHQNFNNHSYVEKITYSYTGLSNPYWGYIRPDWNTTPAAKGEITYPTIHLERDVYTSGETVDFTWDKTSSDTDFYQYWIVIVDLTRNKEIYAGPSGDNEDVNKNYYNIILNDLGDYRITVYAVPYNDKETRQKYDVKTISVVEGGTEMTNGAGQTIPDGDYWIYSDLAKNYYLDVDGIDVPAAPRTNVALYSGENVLPACDAFHVEYLDNGFYKITQLNTDMALVVKKGSKAPTANVYVYQYSGAKQNQWSIEKSGNSFVIRSRCNGYYLNIDSESAKNFVNVNVNEKNNSLSQQWSFVPYYDSAKCHNLVSVLAKEVTCTQDGNIAYWYCTNCKKYFSDSACTKEIALANTVVKATGHKWNNVTYTWSTDNKTCTATRVCANDSSHNETETVNTTYSVTKEPTCIDKGIGTYTATFKNTAFAKQTKGVELQPIPNPTPKVPELTETATEEKVTLKWKPIANAEKYGIAGYVNGKWKLLNECYTISYELKKLKPGTEYKVAVVVMFDGKWNLDFSNAVEFTTPIPIPKITYEKGNGSVKLTWNTVSGAQKYGIAGYQNGAWQLLDKTTGSSYILKNLKAGTNYKVAVIAMFNSNWNMDFSNAITVTPKEATVNLYPAVQTQVKDSKIGFKWTKVPGAEKYGIGIYQANKWKVVKQLDGSITTWTSPQVRNGTYRLVVLAKVDGQWVNADVFKKAFYVTVS